MATSVTVRVRRCISTTVCGRSHGIEDFRISSDSRVIEQPRQAQTRFKLRQSCGKRDCGPQDQAHSHHHPLFDDPRLDTDSINSLFFNVEAPMSRRSVKASPQLLGRPRNTPIALLPTHIHVLRFLLPRQASFDIGGEITYELRGGEVSATLG